MVVTYWFYLIVPRTESTIFIKNLRYKRWILTWLEFSICIFLRPNFSDNYFLLLHKKTKYIYVGIYSSKLFRQLFLVATLYIFRPKTTKTLPNYTIWKANTCLRQLHITTGISFIYRNENCFDEDVLNRTTFIFRFLGKNNKVISTTASFDQSILGTKQICGVYGNWHSSWIIHHFL